MNAILHLLSSTMSVAALLTKHNSKANVFLAKLTGVNFVKFRMFARIVQKAIFLSTIQSVNAPLDLLNTKICVMIAQMLNIVRFVLPLTSAPNAAQHLNSIIPQVFAAAHFKQLSLITLAWLVKSIIVDSAVKQTSASLVKTTIP